METDYTKWMSDEEFSRIRTFVDGLQSPSMRMVFYFMMYTGTPPIDAVKLRICDFRHDFKEAHIIRQKTRRPYRIVIPSFLRDMLKFYVEHYSKRFVDQHLFFASWRNQSTHKHLTTDSLRAVMTRIRRACNLTEIYYTQKTGNKLHRISLYTFRHYCAEKIFNASNYNIMFVRDYLNHKKIDTTQEYLRGFLVQDNVRDIIEKAFV